MSHENRNRERAEGAVYRLEIRGRLTPGRSRWLEAESTTAAGPNTVLLIRVQDQADLHGRLRKIHDLNLQLLSVQTMEVDDVADSGDSAHNGQTEPPRP